MNNQPLNLNHTEQILKNSNCPPVNDYLNGKITLLQMQDSKVFVSNYNKVNPSTNFPISWPRNVNSYLNKPFPVSVLKYIFNEEQLANIQFDPNYQLPNKSSNDNSYFIKTSP